VYDASVAELGIDHEASINSALNYSVNLIGLGKYSEAQSLLRKSIPIARQKEGAESDSTLQLRSLHAATLFQPDGATRAEVREAITTLEVVVRVARRVFGKSHPRVGTFQATLDDAKAKLASFDAPS